MTQCDLHSAEDTQDAGGFGFDLWQPCHGLDLSRLVPGSCCLDQGAYGPRGKVSKLKACRLHGSFSKQKSCFVQGDLVGSWHVYICLYFSNTFRYFVDLQCWSACRCSQGDPCAELGGCLDGAIEDQRPQSAADLHGINGWVHCKPKPAAWLHESPIVSECMPGCRN